MPDLLIPQVFHQIWLGDKELPANFKAWADRWLTLNPGWKMQWWTDHHLPPMKNRPIFDQADKMAAKSDILRYEILAQQGGIYIDSDMEPLRPLAQILPGVNAFYADERPDTPCNAILGCIPNHPFFQQLVDALPASFQGPGDIVDKTGPRFLKRQMQTFLGEKPQRNLDGRRWQWNSAHAGHTLWGFDWRLFYPYYYTEPEREHDAFPDAYAKHHWTASWWKNGGV